MQLVPSKPGRFRGYRIPLHALGDLPQDAGPLFAIGHHWRNEAWALHQQIDFGLFGQIAPRFRYERPATVNGFGSVVHATPSLISTNSDRRLLMNANH
jgi:hypothetical protein